ncbi:amylo-alpha-1,6-glucosidase [Pseudochryseolinea flava]|uniref:Glycogen debranching protein n=1 Tax=Pseudochryseolinea flava TaxID=2059302 RepID=A0A364XYE8_9BACT|nr:amylo-alpha-1,6-glucosidase [Pseudochryseolinea flava]RAV99466.1 glycogen debranching protein [Pseudochryseolinea flava]
MKDLQNFEKSLSLEWLETNGVGGYASSTVAGAHSRKYHGMLVASLNPPVNRMVVVSKLEETIVFGEREFQLSANQYPGVIHPRGTNHLVSFERDLFPVFRYEADGVIIQKTIAAIHGENTTVVLYAVIAAPSSFTLELLPKYSCRDIHHLTFANDSIGSQYLFDKGIFRTLNYQGCPEFFISVPGATFTEAKSWFHNIEYEVERQRGLDFKEDLFSHGKFSIELMQGDVVGVILSTQDPKRKNAVKLFDDERKRRELLVENEKGTIRKLVLAADQFIVKRGNLNTIIAGYHWFSDWGRDTMISLPGLCLATGRFQDAKKILKVFAESIKDGMLPNRFPDDGESPEYNTIDATLWYFYAIYKYYRYTDDLAFVKSLIPILKDILSWHIKGTAYNIGVDPADDLLAGGAQGAQLTWMDAKVGDWVVTPRRGKPVEINALWYNALCILEHLLIRAGDKVGSVLYRDQAQRVAKNFNAKFWNTDGEYLFDVIDGDDRSSDIRPNQLYAISLPFSLLSLEQAEKVLACVAKHLVTPRGLRSLSPANPAYKGIYQGNVLQRDGAYHQGTVWSFLIGCYIDALIETKGKEGKTEATALLKKMTKHIDESCVGSISEIFDGDAPHAPKGCVAQAWGVAELLRVVKEHQLLV